MVVNDTSYDQRIYVLCTPMLLCATVSVWCFKRKFRGKVLERVNRTKWECLSKQGRLECSGICREILRLGMLSLYAAVVAITWLT